MKIARIRYTLLLLSAIFKPAMAFADFTLASSSFSDFIKEIVSYINILLPILMVVAFVVFFWGLAKIIQNSGNATQIAAGREYIMWGIIALFGLLALFGIINFIMGNLGFDFVPINGILLRT